MGPTPRRTEENEMTDLELLAAWNEAQVESAAAQNRENQLRMAVATQIYGYDPEKLQTGTKNFALPNGYKAKMTFKVNESVEQGRVDEAFAELKKLGVPDEIAKSVLKPKYEFKKTGYKMLSLQAAKDAVDCITTRKPGMPTLEIVSPKVEGV